MIVDFDSKFRPRKNSKGKVRFYESDSTAEFDERGLLIGMSKTDLSIELADKIMEFSGYLQAVQEAIREGIRYQEHEQTDAQIERESRKERGQKEVSSGVWRIPGSKINLYEFMSDYPMKPKRERK